MGKQVAKVSESKALVKRYDALLQAAANQLEAVLPRSMDVSAFIQMARNSLAKSESLQECTLPSLMSAAMDSAEWGLYLGGSLAEAHLIPFGGQAVLVPDWKGLVKLAMQHPLVEDVQAHCIYENDHFDYQLGSHPNIDHHPAWQTPRGAFIGAYALIWLVGAKRAHPDVMSKDQIEAVRRKSPMPDSPAWKNYYSEMARKTVLKRALKGIPKSRSLMLALEADNAYSPETRDRNIASELPQLMEATILPPSLLTEKAQAEKLEEQLKESANGRGKEETAATSDQKPHETQVAAGGEGAEAETQGAPSKGKGKAAKRRGKVAADEGGGDAAAKQPTAPDFTLTAPGEQPMETEEFVEVLTVVSKDGVPVHTIAEHKVSKLLYCDCQGDWQSECEHVKAAKEVLG